MAVHSSHPQPRVFSPLLNFPSLLDRGLSRIIDLKQRFGSLFTQMSAMFGQPEGDGMYNQAFGRIEAMKSVIEQVNTQIQDPVTGYKGEDYLYCGVYPRVSVAV